MTYSRQTCWFFGLLVLMAGCQDQGSAPSSDPGLALKKVTVEVSGMT